MEKENFSPPNNVTEDTYLTADTSTPKLISKQNRTAKNYLMSNFETSSDSSFSFGSNSRADSFIQNSMIDKSPKSKKLDKANFSQNILVLNSDDEENNAKNTVNTGRISENGAVSQNLKNILKEKSTNCIAPSTSVSTKFENKNLSSKNSLRQFVHNKNNRFNSSNDDDSVVYDPKNDRSRSIVYTKKETRRILESSVEESFKVIRQGKNVISSDSESDNDKSTDDSCDDESKVEEVPENGNKLDENIQPVERTKYQNSINCNAAKETVDIECNSSADISEIPPIDSSDSISSENAASSHNEKSNDVIDTPNDSSDNQDQFQHSDGDDEFAKLNERLTHLLLAEKKAKYLPDGGARLQAKIAEIRSEIRTLSLQSGSKILPPLPAATKPKFVNDYLINADTFNNRAAGVSSTVVKNQHLFATNEDQMNRLYGGRMNLARKMEVRAVTQDAVEELHLAINSCPQPTEETDDPKCLRVPLLRHQRQALTWLKWRETKKPPGGVLADDMGLGKTLTMISLVMLQRKSAELEKENPLQDVMAQYKLVPSKATLVICPLTLMSHWKDEIEKYVKPCPDVLVYHGTKRDINARRMAMNDFVITSYGTVSSEVGDGDEAKVSKKKKNPTQVSVLLQVGWDRIILDESHTIKNRKSVVSKSCCRLPGGKRWALTGTPIHNRLEDLFSLLKFLRCEPFDEWEVWKKWIENKSETARRRLNTIVKGILLRRTKDQICSITQKPLVDLPPKRFSTHHIDLQPLERKVYDRLFEASKQQIMEFVKLQEDKDREFQAVNSGVMRYAQMGYKNPFLPKQRKALGGGDADQPTPFGTSHVFVLLLRLRQACTHLALMKEAVNLDAFDVMGDEGEEQDLVTKINEMSFIEKKDLDVVSDKIDGVGQLFELYYIRLVLESIDRVLETNTSNAVNKIVVVSQWTQLLYIFAEHLRKRGVKFTQIDGRVKVEDRTERVKLFNTPNRSPIVLLLSLTAGGVGLNLVGGNHLFLLDNHWNPALEQQACDRIYRLGQQKNVFIHKFVCKKTIEERVFELQNSKKELANAVMTGAGSIRGLSKDELKFLFELDRPTCRKN